MKSASLQNHPKRMAKAKKFCVTLALALISCNSFGSSHPPPTLPIPAQWNTTSSLPAHSAPSEAATLAQWWWQFNDPVLNAFVDDAITSNRDLASARAKLREARARRNFARGKLGPALGASASASRKRASTDTGHSTRSAYQAGFDARWEIDLFGVQRHGLEAAKADLEATREMLRDTQVSLVAEVVANYVELRTAEQRLAIAEASLATRRETYSLADWRAQAGLASELDIAQARTELESASASLPALQTEIAAAQNRLAVLLGRPPGEIPTLVKNIHNKESDNAIPVGHESIAIGIPADALRQRPDVRAAERELAAQASRLRVAKAERYPRFELSGSIGLEALTLSALGDHEAAVRSLLGKITVPIFESGRIQANIEIQDALLEQAELHYQTAILAALEDVENALVAVHNTKERYERLAAATQSARTTFQLAEQRYASGLIDFIAVLDSQRTLHSLEDQSASSTSELARAQIQLYKALGGGWSVETAATSTPTENAKEPE